MFGAFPPRPITAQPIMMQNAIRNTQNIRQKTAIAEYAVSLVKEHQVVALDYGNTSQILADNPGFTTILTVSGIS